MIAVDALHPAVPPGDRLVEDRARRARPGAGSCAARGAATPGRWSAEQRCVQRIRRRRRPPWRALRRAPCARVLVEQTPADPARDPAGHVDPLDERVAEDECAVLAGARQVREVDAHLRAVRAAELQRARRGTRWVFRRRDSSECQASPPPRGRVPCCGSASRPGTVST